MSDHSAHDAAPSRTDSKKRKRTEDEGRKSKKVKKTKTSKNVSKSSEPLGRPDKNESRSSSKAFKPSDEPLPPITATPAMTSAPAPSKPKSKAKSKEPVEEAAVVELAGISQHKTRFIAFIGNLPFTATDETVAKHFVKIKPTSIRHRTPKEGDKLPKGHRAKDPKPTSKGFAFLEFDNYDRMRSCLQLYHHSTFDDGISKARKINVELTAGGGGRGEGRKEKLKTKNERLKEQRQRRAKREEEEGKRKPRAAKKGGDASTEETKKASESVDKSDAAASQGEIHPSRMAQIQPRR